MLKPLPIGLQTFENLIKGNYLYIDKTPYIYELIKDQGLHRYFLSRPRRFGKSLLISTLEAIFLGKKDLFKGLYIYEHTSYDWQNYPMIRLDFAGISNNQEELAESLKRNLQDIARTNNVELIDQFNMPVKDLFKILIRNMFEKHQKQVIVLIDEYDKPIIDHLGKDMELAQKNRDMLKGFYGVLKSEDAYIKFIFITGISKFSRVSIFSDLNNLDDLSMDSRCAGLLGYTQEELGSYFKEYLINLESIEKMSPKKLLIEIKNHYNGYRFSDLDFTMYNPFSILLLFSKNKFDNYWFNSGTPTFLIELLLNKEAQDNLTNLEFNKPVSPNTFNSYELDNLAILALLVQTGYLTIKEYYKEDDLYLLGYPNQEVRESFLSYFLERAGRIVLGYSRGKVVELRNNLRQSPPDFESFFMVLKSFFANVPYDIQVSQEKYYQSLFFCVFALLGYFIRTEVTTNIGRIDAVVETNENIFLFEFKLNDTKENALNQIKQKKYDEKYQGQKKTIYLIGVCFDIQLRNIKDYIIEISSLI